MSKGICIVPETLYVCQEGHAQEVLAEVADQCDDKVRACLVSVEEESMDVIDEYSDRMVSWHRLNAGSHRDFLQGAQDLMGILFRYHSVLSKKLEAKGMRVSHERLVIVDVDSSSTDDMICASIVVICFFIQYRMASLWDAYRSLSAIDGLRPSLPNLGEKIWRLLGDFEERHHDIGTLRNVLDSMTTSVKSKESATFTAASFYNLLAKSRELKHRRTLGNMLIMDIRSAGDYKAGHLRHENSAISSASLPVTDRENLPSPDTVDIKDRMQARVWKQWRMRFMVIYGGANDQKEKELLVAFAKSVESQLKVHGSVCILGSPFSKFAQAYPFLVNPAPARAKRASRPMPTWYPAQLLPSTASAEGVGGVGACGGVFFWDARQTDKYHYMLTELKITTAALAEGVAEIEEMDQNIVVETDDFESLMAAIAAVERARLDNTRVVIVAGGSTEMHTFAADYFMLVKGVVSVDLAGRLLDEMNICLEPDWPRVERFISHLFGLGQAQGKGGAAMDDRKPCEVVEGRIFIAPLSLGVDLPAMQALDVDRVIVASKNKKTFFTDVLEYLTIDFENVNGDFNDKFTLMRKFVSGTRHPHKVPVEDPDSLRNSEEATSKTVANATPADTREGEGKDGADQDNRRHHRVVILGSPSKVTCLAAAYIVGTDKIGATEAFERIRSKSPWARITKDDAYRLEAFQDALVKLRQMRSSKTSYIPEHMCSVEKEEEDDEEDEDSAAEHDTKRAEAKLKQSADRERAAKKATALKPIIASSSSSPHKSNDAPRKRQLMFSEEEIVNFLKWKAEKVGKALESALATKVDLENKLRRMKIEKERLMFSTINLEKEKEKMKSERDMYKRHSTGTLQREVTFGGSDTDEEEFVVKSENMMEALESTGAELSPEDKAKISRDREVDALRTEVQEGKELLEKLRERLVKAESDLKTTKAELAATKQNVKEEASTGEEAVDDGEREEIVESLREQLKAADEKLQWFRDRLEKSQNALAAIKAAAEGGTTSPEKKSADEVQSLRGQEMWRRGSDSNGDKTGRSSMEWAKGVAVVLLAVFLYALFAPDPSSSYYDDSSFI
uniref:Rhodanese domain-containing protein n=1 Tax=Lotharella globosa TaxID=91324 RepID=A0A7S3Z752_9EUKA|mmetsp:Transcript_11017/g.21876  ORF Transcript_11017/g.21876 Transcript_11017/m.21876 type:complete len:1075 (-) Transcript_11017:800-4024(-)